jgi:hypothetical protein
LQLPAALLLISAAVDVAGDNGSASACRTEATPHHLLESLRLGLRDGSAQPRDPVVAATLVVVVPRGRRRLSSINPCSRIRRIEQ